MDNCPKCKTSWIGDDIPEDMREHYSPPYKWRREVGIEYSPDDPYRYDGISEWMCPDCKTRFGRWTERVLTGEQKEPPFGEMKYVRT